MPAAWSTIFDNFGVKKVTNTDKSKGAYVPSQAQCRAIEAAGIPPATTRPAPDFDIVVLFDPDVSTTKASYYYSVRSAQANRSPEPRMGHAFVSSWLNIGDEVLIGNIGSQVFALKITAASASNDAVNEEVAKRADRTNVFERARRAAGQPNRRVVQRDDFARNPYVVAAAIIRSGGRCEMPGCTHELFLRDDGTTYLEVHHIHPLSQGGDDTLVNVAALCPHCHREQHSGRNREARKITLRDHVASLPAI